MSFDIFPTLLAFAGIDNPIADTSHAVSLLEPRSSRPRLSEYTAPFTTAFRTVRERHPDWQSAPWETALNALTFDQNKLVRRSVDGTTEVYQLASDGAETIDVSETQPELRSELETLLDRHLAATTPFRADGETLPTLSEDQRRRLQALGYLDSSDETPATPEAP